MAMPGQNIISGKCRIQAKQHGPFPVNYGWRKTKINMSWKPTFVIRRVTNSGNFNFRWYGIANWVYRARYGSFPSIGSHRTCTVAHSGYCIGDVYRQSGSCCLAFPRAQSWALYCSCCTQNAVLQVTRRPTTRRSTSAHQPLTTSTPSTGLQPA